MEKYYKITAYSKSYWEFWSEKKGYYLVHWGELGTTGETKSVKGLDSVKLERSKMLENGYHKIEDEDHAVLLVEYSIGGMGTKSDVEKRHRLEDRMNDTLGWSGLGNCDGGSIGSGTMEICCYVVDFEIAKRVIESDLKGTEFENYTRIYRENG